MKTYPVRVPRDSHSLPCAISLALAGRLPLIAARVPTRLRAIHVALRIEQPQRSR